jgi:amidophosphoribosyltransferase
MARELGCDSLRYLPVESISAAIGFDSSTLCQACISGNYPTPAGQQLYELDLAGATGGSRRAYEAVG